MGKLRPWLDPLLALPTWVHYPHLPVAVKITLRSCGNEIKFRKSFRGYCLIRGGRAINCAASSFPHRPASIPRKLNVQYQASSILELARRTILFRCCQFPLTEIRLSQLIRQTLHFTSMRSAATTACKMMEHYLPLPKHPARNSCGLSNTKGEHSKCEPHAS